MDSVVAYPLPPGGGGYPTPLGVEGREPAWSPQGTSLVFASSGGLRSIELATSLAGDLTSDPTDASPRWRMDGLPIVGFERQVGPDDWNRYELDLANPAAPLESLVSSETGFEGDPAYRPGGGSAYVTDNGFPGTTRYVYVEIPSAFGALYAGQNPSWSPDGERIVADDGNGRIWWTEKDAAGSQRFVTNSGSDRDPDWGPPPGPPRCSNGLDDDGDGFVDLADPGCADAADNDERGPALVCDNGLDDDGDGATDCEDTDCGAVTRCIPAVFMFLDRTNDDIARTALKTFFQGLAPEPTDFILFQLFGGSPTDGAWCATRADWYLSTYLTPPSKPVSSGAWNRWSRPQGGAWTGPTTAGFANTYGTQGSSGSYSWLSEQGLGGQQERSTTQGSRERR